MDVQIILFVYGIAMIMLFSMLSLQTYKDWVSKKGQLIDFIIFALIDVITIIAFILQFKN
jgi:uncharacterized membrane protein YdjX (TVP38/TMEM64 family)|tara:strand:+ start:47 stop:226 length:180 start_codon:yes stop_codon:yes gene_type:complete